MFTHQCRPIVFRILSLSGFLFLLCGLIHDVAAQEHAEDGNTDFGSIQYSTTVVSRQTAGYEAFRIPVLRRASNGDLLLICEARKKESDFGNIDLMQFRSTDQGKTWDSGTVLVDRGSKTVCDPGLLVDGNRIHLLFQTRPGKNSSFRGYQTGRFNTSRAFHMTSNDHGKSWTNPQNITDEVMPEPDKQIPAFGPNNGIVLDSGRLVMPLYYADQSTKSWAPAVTYSDDDGTGWKRSPDAFVGEQINETAVVQVNSGDLYAVARDHSGDGNQQKRFFMSESGGSSWTRTGDLDPVIPANRCQQSMVAAGNQIFLANPHERSRDNGHLTTGIYDREEPDLVDWNKNSLQITPGGFAYSSMALHKSTIHMVYEKHVSNKSYNYESLEYVRVSLNNRHRNTGSESK